jgi:hypothetical protein
MKASCKSESEEAIVSVVQCERVRVEAVEVSGTKSYSLVDYHRIVGFLSE